MEKRSRGRQTKVVQKARNRKRNRNRGKHLLIWIPCVLILLAGGFLASQTAMNRHFETTYYHFTSDKVDTPIKLAVLSDLHNTEYGEGNSELIEAIEKEKPDFVAMIGDMVNGDEMDFTVIRHLCRELTQIAPVYYSLGNHEKNLMFGSDPTALDEMLREDGVTVLNAQAADFTKGGTTIHIAGLAIEEESNYRQWAEDALKNFWQSEEYKILLSHFPKLCYNRLKDRKMDLALAGHYHGGQIRLPGGKGLYHPDEGFFTEYSGGEYPLTNGTLVVSRGIGSHGVIPRINNRPELVIIEIE